MTSFHFLIPISILVMAALAWRWYRDVLSLPWRFHYFIHGFRARNRSFSPAVLEEENDTRRLLHLLPYIAASFTPVILILPREKLVLSALCYLYWRILDTFDDLLTGEERERGLSILGKRLRLLDRGGFAMAEPGIEDLHFSIVGPRDEIYIQILKSLDRLDSLFLEMDEQKRDILIRFVEHQTEDFRSVPPRHFKTRCQYREKCVTTIMSGLYLATFELIRPGQSPPVDRNTRAALEDVCVAFNTGNIIKDLEKDFCQGISYHPDLVPRGIAEEILPAEREKLKQARAFLTYWGIRHLPVTCEVFQSEWNETFLTRFMSLLLKTYLMNQYRKCWCEVRGEAFDKPNTKRVFIQCFTGTLLGWRVAIVDLDRDLLSWRPGVEPLWHEVGE